MQPQFAALARERAASLGDRVRFVEGDITAPIDVPTAGVIAIWHLAAIYDLSVPRDRGLKVNVDGTRNVLDFAERCRDLERLHYVSTCYVSGRYDGIFHEDDLDVGQKFNNYYEETKYLAEVDVRRRGLPATIYRPSVTVGDSATGATQKFDGPYFVLQWLLRQPKIAMLPVVGRPSRHTFNCVPRDFVVDAIERLSARDDDGLRCYAVADPKPLTVDETIDVIAEAAGRRVIRVPMTTALAKLAIERVPGVYRLMRIPSAAVDYFSHPTHYATTHATLALGTTPPPLGKYVHKLVAFFRAHPEIGSAAMA